MKGEQMKGEQTKGEQTKGTDIMLVAYMRTGSTFLGDVLGRRQDVFYWYEPLIKGRSENYLRGADMLCNYFRPNCEIISIHDMRSGVNALDLLTDIFDCNIRGNIDEISGLPYIWKTPPPSWRDFVNCTHRYTRKDPRCAGILQKSCTNSNHRMVKVLRMDLETLGGLLHTNPQLKIVLLLRDPRGSMNSRLSTTWYKGYINTDAHVNDDAKVLCSRLLNDINTGKRLQLLHPDRMIIIQYEGIGTTDKIEALYKLLDLDKLEKDIVEPVDLKDHTAQSKSGFHPFAFRQKLPWSVNIIMNRHCADVYKELGLRPFEREGDFRNETIPVIIDKLPFSLPDQQ
ncbi:CHST1-like protein [Mya arenaria]|uniref:CHST1-like protein n=1 Tax=Mya arenaria TaxID=6604 RepID=A0ABY7GB64_MYAAR|nr:CHST1-like protein [Mya arenaria]